MHLIIENLQKKYPGKYFYIKLRDNIRQIRYVLPLKIQKKKKKIKI